MAEVGTGRVLKVYLEIEPSTQSPKRICLFLEGLNWIEFTGVTLKDGFVLPSPLGCDCTVTDISDRQWELADYEVTFASSYSDEGTFHAKFVNQIHALTM